MFLKLLDNKGWVIFTSEVEDFSEACREAECHTLCTSMILEGITYNYDYNEHTGESFWIKEDGDDDCVVPI